MPDGHVQSIDDDRVFVVRNGRRFVAPLGEVESAARVPGARVHFDIDHRDGSDNALRVKLVSGTRTNRRQRRFGDLTGAKQPGAKVKSTSASRLGVDVTTQPIRVVRAWLDSMAEGSFDDATSVYAPNAVVHTGDQTVSGRRAIRAALEDVVGRTVQSQNVRVDGVDQLVHVADPDKPEMEEWFEVDRGSIIEHWHDLVPAQIEADSQVAPIAIIRSGEIDSSQERRLREDLERMAARAHGPIEDIRVKIDAPTTPSHPFSVSISLFTDGAHVRSHVTAPTFEEAIDTVCLRLRRQLDKAADRLNRRPAQHRPDGTSWRHGDRPVPGALIDGGPIPSAREIVRHKSWGPSRSSIDEAIWDMEQADYDFYLFNEETSGDAALVWRGDDNFEVRFASGNQDRANHVPGSQPGTPSEFAVIHTDPAQRMSVDLARTMLNETHDPFVFATSSDGGAFVLYRRLDGHFGLIEPVEDLSIV